MGADRAGKAVGIRVEHEAIDAAVGRIDAGKVEPGLDIRQGRAVHAAPDHSLRERCRVHADALGLRADPAPEATHVLGELAKDEIRAVAPEVIYRPGLGGRVQ